MQSREPIARRFQPYFDRIQRSAIRVFNSLSLAPRQVRRNLQPVQEELLILTEETHRLCRRMTALENHRLVTERTSDLQADLAQIDDAIAKAGDPEVKQQYEASRRSLLERIAKRKLAASDLDRVEAQLVGLANEMDGVVTEVIRLQVASPAEAERQVPSLVGKLRQQSQALRQSEQEATRV
jgi:chromosome segregation ATPase